MSRTGKAGTASLRYERVYDAPREAVFRAWTDPDELRQWFFPSGGSCQSAEIELRVGGSYRFGMKPMAWQTVHMFGRFLEVDPPRRLVYTLDWEDIRLLRPAETLVTVEFHEVGRATKVVLTHERLRRGPHRTFHAMGWRPSLRRLGRLMTAGTARADGAGEA